MHLKQVKPDQGLNPKPLEHDSTFHVPETPVLIPLSHYSMNAPRIHNVGHFFQISKVPSGVCKFRIAFLLDS